MEWSARPFVRVLFFYVAGILLVQAIGALQKIPAIYYYALLIILIFCSVLVYQMKIPLRLKWLSGFCIGLLILLFGMLKTQQHFTQLNNPLPAGDQYYYAEVTKVPSATEKSIKTVLKISQMHDSVERKLKHPAQTMAYFYQDSLSENLKLGDQLIFYGELKAPPKPLNPFEFNYKVFLQRNNIPAMVYISAEKWTLVEQGSKRTILYIANEARSFLLNALKENGVGGRNYAVASAVILGYDQLMDEELEQQFVGAGAMHILCVSGLHVGIVYLVLNTLLSFLNKKPWKLWLKAFLLLIMVWSYALLTGLSPSVIRASTMLTVFIVGQPTKRGRDHYNTLAISAFAMLVYDPMLLFNVGFQLSYSAVLGIFIFYKPIYNLVYIKQYIGNKIWSIVVVSIAAQLGTFPLAAHYFHFFPTYFWLTNILIFPLSFVIIGLGMFFVVTAWIAVLPKFIGFFLSISISLLNYSVGLVNMLPGHGIEDLYFPWLKVWLVYGLLIFLFQWMVMRKVTYAKIALFALLCLLTFQTVHKYSNSRQQSIIVYNIKNHTAIDAIQGTSLISFMDSTLRKDPFKQNYHLNNARVAFGVSGEKHLVLNKTQNFNSKLFTDGTFGQFGSFKFALIEEGKKYSCSGTEKIQLDVIIVTGRKSLDLDKLSFCFEFDAIIMNASVPYWKRKKR